MEEPVQAEQPHVNGVNSVKQQPQAGCVDEFFGWVTDFCASDGYKNLRGLCKENAELKKQLHEQKCTNLGSARLVADTHDRLRARDDEYDQLSREKKDVEAELAEEQRKYKEMTELQEKTAAELAAQIETTNQREQTITGLEETIGQRDETIKDLEDRLAAEQQKLREALDKIADLERQLAEKEEEINQKDNKIRTLQETVGIFQSFTVKMTNCHNHLQQ